MGKQTFYDQWHRIAELRLGLRPSVAVRQQKFRNDIFYVYHELIHSGFFRARPETHVLIQLIKPSQTLHEVWRGFVNISPKTAPGQKDFFDLITALYSANLVYVEGGVNEERLLERALQKKKKPIAAKISELLFFRIPLLDPERFLKRVTPFIRIIYGLPAICLVFLMCFWAGYEFVLGADRAFSQSKTILQMGNLLPLYIAMFLTHIAHEFSHAALCKFYGGNVRTVGVMLLMFTPLPYADVSASWAFRNKWHRAAVGAAGMYSDIIFCSIAIILWAYSPPGVLNEVAMNLMFVTAVYTVFFNANPLMRFDGYYILSDLVAIPNLHTAAKKQVSELFKNKVLSEPETNLYKVSQRRKIFLATFFIASNTYRIIIMVGIVKFIADQYFGLGLAVAAALAYSTFLAPVAKFLKPLGEPSFMAKHRKKALGASASLITLLAIVVLVPLPYARILEGVVEATEKTRIFVPVNGIVDKVYPRSGEWVERGDPIIAFSNPELYLELQGIDAKIRGVQSRISQSLAQGSVTFAAIEQEYETMKVTRSYIVSQISKLLLKAPHAGLWTSPGMKAHIGQWLMRGAEVGVVLRSGDYEFKAILKQKDASEISAMVASDATAKLEGQRDSTLSVLELRVIPFSQKDLPSVAVSPLAGGDVAMDLQNKDNPQAAERFFLIVSSLSTESINSNILDGRRGWLRIKLPSRSVGQRVYANVRQFFQRRYKL